jgi:hypothetical protein
MPNRNLSQLSLHKLHLQMGVGNQEHLNKARNSRLYLLPHQQLNRKPQVQLKCLIKLSNS